MKFKIETESESKYINGVLFFHQISKPYAVSAEAHIHDTIEIIFVTEGNFTVLADSDKYEIFAGDMILFRSNVIHNIFSGADKKSAYYVLKIRPNTAREFIGGLHLLEFLINKNGVNCVWTKAELQNTPDILNGFERLKTTFSQNVPYAELSVKLAAEQILLGILCSRPNSSALNTRNATDKSADCIYKAMAYINKNYREDISESEISSAIGLSYHYFSRTFKQITGKSFKEYLNLTRVNHAERLLVTTDKSVSEIASECGYNDTSYFIKLYKKHKNTSPGMTRKQKQII